MTIDPQLSAQALEEALAKYPQYRSSNPVLHHVELFGGSSTFIVKYDNYPAKDDPDVWEFQNAFVKGYKRLAGL